MKENCKQCSREELKEIVYCFHQALEIPSETCTTERTYKLWRERNKTKRSYVDANKLKMLKRLTDAELQEIKNEIKTIIKKIKEKVLVIGQP